MSRRQKLVHAIKQAPIEHRIMAAISMMALWYLTEEVLHWAIAAKGIEVFGLVPFADKAMSFLLGE